MNAPSVTDVPDVLVVRTSRGTFTWSPDGGLQPSPVPYWYYVPEVVISLLDPPAEYWAWRAETEADL